MHEIVEEDEASSESSDDFNEDVDEQDEDGDVALEMGGQLIERRRYIAEGGRTSMSKDEDGIIFDIEGDHAGGYCTYMHLTIWCCSGILGISYNINYVSSLRCVSTNMCKSSTNSNLPRHIRYCFTDHVALTMQVLRR
jgi:hypothetical protein